MKYPTEEEALRGSLYRLIKAKGGNVNSAKRAVTPMWKEAEAMLLDDVNVADAWKRLLKASKDGDKAGEQKANAEHRELLAAKKARRKALAA